MIEYINYKGKSHPVRIAYIALNGFKKETGKSFDQIGDAMKKGDGMDLEVYEPLLFYGLKAGHAAEEIEFTFERDQMEAVLDECLWEFIAMIPKFMEAAGLGETGNRAQRRKKN